MDEINNKEQYILHKKYNQYLDLANNTAKISTELNNEIISIGNMMVTKKINNNIINSIIKRLKYLISRLLSMKQATLIIASMNKLGNHVTEHITHPEDDNCTQTKTNLCAENNKLENGHSRMHYKKIVHTQSKLNEDKTYINDHSLTTVNDKKENKIKIKKSLGFDYINYNKHLNVSLDLENNKNNIKPEKNLTNLKQIFSKPNFTIDSGNGTFLNENEVFIITYNKNFKNKKEYVSLYDNDFKIQDEMLKNNINSETSTNSSILISLFNEMGQESECPEQQPQQQRNKKVAKRRSNSLGNSENCPPNDLLIKQAIVNLANKNNEAFMPDASLKLDKLKSSKRKKDEQITKDEETKIREFMKSRPEFVYKKKLTVNVIDKIRILMKNEEKHEKLQEELKRDRMPNIYGLQNQHPSPIPSSSNTSFAKSTSDDQDTEQDMSQILCSTAKKTNNNRELNKTAYLSCNNSTIELNRAGESTIDQQSNTTEILQNDPSNIQMIESLEDTSIEDEVFENENKKLKSIVTNVNSFSVQNEITKMETELLELKKLVTIITDERNEMKSSQQNDMKIIIELQNEEKQKLEDKLKRETSNQYSINLELENLEARHQSTRCKQFTKDSELLTSVDDRLKIAQLNYDTKCLGLDSLKKIDNGHKAMANELNSTKLTLLASLNPNSKTQATNPKIEVAITHNEVTSENKSTNVPQIIESINSAKQPSTHSSVANNNQIQVTAKIVTTQTSHSVNSSSSSNTLPKVSTTTNLLIDKNKTAQHSNENKSDETNIKNLLNTNLGI